MYNLANLPPSKILQRPNIRTQTHALRTATTTLRLQNPPRDLTSSSTNKSDQQSSNLQLLFPAFSTPTLPIFQATQKPHLNQKTSQHPHIKLNEIPNNTKLHFNRTTQNKFQDNASTCFQVLHNHMKISCLNSKEKFKHNQTKHQIQ